MNRKSTLLHRLRAHPYSEARQREARIEERATAGQAHGDRVAWLTRLVAARCFHPHNGYLLYDVYDPFADKVVSAQEDKELWILDNRPRPRCRHESKWWVKSHDGETVKCRECAREAARSRWARGEGAKPR